MNKQNILALALKPAMRVTESVGIGIVLMLAAALIAMITPSAVSAAPPCETPTATLLVTGLEGAQGSTVGPDGALYVTEGAVGRIWRVDPKTGQVTTFASGLPSRIIGIGMVGRSTSRSSARPPTHWSLSSAPMPAAPATLSASTEWTARQFHCRR